MKKHKWEKVWEEKKFNIKTLIPSILVKKYKHMLPKDNLVLDVGCGNGRNSIYLSDHGCKINCFDVMDLGWLKKIPDNIKKNIKFKKSDIINYNYGISKYDAVIISRIIRVNINFGGLKLKNHQ